MPTIRVLETIGVEEMRIIRTTESPRWVQNAGDMCLSLEEYFEAGAQIAEQCLKENIQATVAVWQLFTLYGRAKAYHLSPVKSGEATYCESTPICKVNRRLIAVAPNGNIVPCNQMSGGLQKLGIHMGNVHQQTLQALLCESEYLNEVTKTVGELAAQNETCRSCKWWKHCAGGCRACALALTGSLKGHDPTKCLFFNGGYLSRL